MMRVVLMKKVAAIAVACVASAGFAVTVFAGGSAANGTPDAATLEKGKIIFNQKAVPACAVCHTMADAGATGTIGPDLDELKPDMTRVKKVLKEGIGAMPSFSATLSEDDLNAVAAYVVHATQAK